MTVITFELAPIEQEVQPGFHTGKIINTKKVTFQDGESQFCVEWKFDKRTLTFFDKFKLWDEQPTKQAYAFKKLNNLCEAAGVSIAYKNDGGTVNFDASVLVGKQVKVFVDVHTTDQGAKFVYCQKYAPLSLADLSNNEIPF